MAASAGSRDDPPRSVEAVTTATAPASILGDVNIGDEAFTSRSVRDTEAIAAGLARSLKGGECLALYGDLGAGKTQFTRGLVRGLGADGHEVSSPTFVLLNVYEGGRLRVFHLDAYRVGGADDFDAIGFGELLEQPDGIVVVEWPSRIEDLLPRSTGRINVRLQALTAHNRRITIERVV